MIGSSDNSGGVVVGAALVCGTESIQRVRISLFSVVKILKFS